MKISDRLQYIREIYGLDLRGLWRRLTGGGAYDVSEASVRNYDIGVGPRGDPREPPYAYLARVLDVFPAVRAEWLMRGEGEPFDPERAVPDDMAVRPVGDVVWQYFAEGAGFNPPGSLRPLALLLWRRRRRAYSLGPADPFEPARHVGAALFAPLRALGLDPASFADAQVESIATALLPGIAAAADFVHDPRSEA